MAKPEKCPYSTERLKALYDRYQSVLLLAQISGVRHSTVLKWMRKRGIDRKAPGGANNPQGYGGKTGKRPY